MTRDAGQESLVAPILVGLGRVAHCRGDAGGAAARQAKGLRRIRDLVRDAGLSLSGSMDEVVLALGILVEALAGVGRSEAAARLLGAAESLPLVGGAGSPPERARRAALGDRVRAGLGDLPSTTPGPAAGL